MDVGSFFGLDEERPADVRMGGAQVAPVLEVDAGRDAALKTVPSSGAARPATIHFSAVETDQSSTASSGVSELLKPHRSGGRPRASTASCHG